MATPNPPETKAAPAENVHAQLARSAKVLKLTMALDAALLMLGVDPFSAQGLEYVLSMNEAAWVEAAKHAGVNLPSETTRRAIEDLYRRRCEIRSCLQRIA